MADNSERTDLIATLAKRAIPEHRNEYVCLGHFDYAKIEQLQSVEEASKTFRKFTQVDRAEQDSEAVRNYLVDSQVGSSEFSGFDGFDFLFMMTITVKQTTGGLSESAKKYNSELKNITSDLELVGTPCTFAWRIYYPIARGDIIIILCSSAFEPATEVLYRLASTTDMQSSYSIPMIRWDWVKSSRTDTLHERTGKCQMRLRAIVKDYNKLDKFIDKLMKKKSFSDVKKQGYASFGTEDMEYDFGIFSESRLREYLSFITEEEHQKEFREELVFSAELGIPRSIDSIRTEWHGK